MSSALRNILCILAVLLLALTSVGIVHAATPAKISPARKQPKQTTTAARQPRPVAPDPLLQVQRQQLEQQREQVKALNQLNDQQQQLVAAVKELSTAQATKPTTIWSALLTAFPALITACTAIFVGWLALDFNLWSTRRTARQDHTRMLMEVDSNLIQRPWLWSIYGRHFEANRGEEEKLKELMKATMDFRTGQEEAMIYSCFNMFEAVFDFHRHLGFPPERQTLLFTLRSKTARGKADAEYKDSWDEFAREFFSDQDGRRNWEVFNDRRRLYSESFGEWVDQIRREAIARSESTGDTRPHSGYIL